MAKGAKQFDPTQLEGKTIKKVDVLGDGYSRLSMEDGTAAVIQVVPISMTVVTSEKASKTKAKEVEDEEEDEDETSIEEMREALVESGMTKKKVKGMSDEEVEEAYEELEEEDEDEEEEDEDSDEDEDEDEDDEDEDEDEDEDDEDDEDSEGHTAEEIDEMDFDDLEDLIDDEELEIDIEEFEDKAASVKKLKAAVKKALKIK